VTTLETTVSLAGIDVRPSRGVAILLRLDGVRALGQAAGALFSTQLVSEEPRGLAEWGGALLGLPWGLGTGATLPGWLPWALLAHGLLVLLALPGCLRLAPRSMSLRRKLGLLAVVEVLALGVGGTTRAVCVTLWTGLIWVTLLRGGLLLSREVARISGEEGLEYDPSHPRL